jgi:hypothetical protein
MPAFFLKIQICYNKKRSLLKIALILEVSTCVTEPRPFSPFSQWEKGVRGDEGSTETGLLM